MLTVRSRLTSRNTARSLTDTALVVRIRTREQELLATLDSELQSRIDDLRTNATTLELTDDRLIETSALICVAGRRALGISFYDVQILSGLTMSRGHVAEMATGEGKTYAAAFPAIIHALAGRGVHVSTSNAYLAERDCAQLVPLFDRLGMRAAHIATQQPVDEKNAAYQCDITYGPGCDFGFDYLRDQYAKRQAPVGRLGDNFLRVLRGQELNRTPTLQRGLIASIVDEIDNVMIDDAGSPLLISGQPEGLAPDAEAHRAAMQLADNLVAETDFRIEATTGVTQLTRTGHDRIWANSDNLPLKILLRPWNSYVEQALRAKYLFRRDVHYLVRDDKVVIVDQSTGRIFEERSWRDGLHQAIEARENVPITAEMQGLARVSRQRFGRLYERLSGLTGTAIECAAEFRDIYRLKVVPIPLRLPSQRRLLPPRYFANDEAKWSAVVAEVTQVHAKGQPILIGTRSIAKSEQLADHLRAAGISFELLNGKQDADEAAIIAKAGRAGAVTIATNMAGRGTDIRPDEAAINAGGLRVIATEHHDAARIDRQLIGRSGRQGEPGAASFFVSADDDLLVRFGESLRTTMKRSTTRTGELDGDWTAAIRKVQQRAERDAELARRQLFQQDKTRDILMDRLAGAPH